MLLKLERLTRFTPAYDKRHPDPAKNYGIGAVQLQMIVAGPEGAIAFLMSTGWNLPHVAEEHLQRSFYTPTDLRVLFRPGSQQLECHHPEPQYEGHSPAADVDECGFMPGRKCYISVAYSQADDYMKELIANGSDAFWTKLEDLYRETFPQAEVADAA